METYIIDCQEAHDDFLDYIKDEKLSIIKQENDCLFLSDGNQYIINSEFSHGPLRFYNPLIFGKDMTMNIIGIEVDYNGGINLFTSDGKKEWRPFSYFMLTNKKVSNRFVELDGNQHYKYITYCKNKKEFSDRYGMAMQTSNDIWTIHNAQEAAMVYTGITMFKNLKFNEVSVLSFDIETNGVKMDKNSIIYIIANTFRDNNGNISKRMFSLDDYPSQKDMLIAWCNYIHEIDPSVLCGHNILGFDLPFIKQVADNEGISLNIGKEKNIMFVNKRESRFRKEGQQFIFFKNINIYGRQIIDTMFLTIKTDVKRQFDTYALKPVIKQLGLEKEDRQFYEASKIKDNWHILEEREKIKNYAKDDGDDALALYDRFAPAYFYMTQSIPKTFQQIVNSATGSQLNLTLVRSYLQDGHSIPNASELTEKIEGGISFGITGIYRNVVKVDLKSAYPSQILRFKLHDPIKDPNANFYKMVKYFTLARFENKRLAKETNDLYYENLEQSGKIFINSAYGICGTPGLNFNNREMASKITGETRQVIDMALKWATGKDHTFYMNGGEKCEEESTENV